MFEAIGRLSGVHCCNSPARCHHNSIYIWLLNLQSKEKLYVIPSLVICVIHLRNTTNTSAIEFHKRFYFRTFLSTSITVLTYLVFRLQASIRFRPWTKIIRLHISQKTVTFMIKLKWLRSRLRAPRVHLKVMKDYLFGLALTSISRVGSQIMHDWRRIYGGYMFFYL